MEGVSGFGSLRKSLRSPIEIWYNPPQIIIPIIEEKCNNSFGVVFDPLMAEFFSKDRSYFLKACFCLPFKVAVMLASPSSLIALHV